MLRTSIVIVMGLLGTAFAGQVLGQAQDRKALAKGAETFLKKHCHQCHGQDGSAEGGFNYILNRERLVEAGKIVPEHADKSKVFKRVRAGTMPPEDVATRPTKEEIALFKQWIDAGAPNFAEAVAVRPLIRPEEMPRLLYADLQNVEERDRRFTRYFTLSHLYNARLSDDELQSYRTALAKLVNSLSWGRKIVVPRPIDVAKTIFRIDLRDYQWTPEIWEALLHRNPYGVLYETNVEKDLQHTTHTQLPYVRGDWFVSDASRPPLYHELLQVPATVHELEKLLRLDAEQNIKSERVHRAGFNSSGISRSNRLIERHESGYGAYWKSYDFAANSGRQNIFAYPLGAGTTDESFQHDGGEMIFTLPNGLHGYMLTNSHGKRLDKGPIQIVSDPRRVDRAVINGLSCMTCHTQGIIAKDDQMRPYLDKNPDAFQARELEAIKALYPSNKKLTEMYEEDQKNFREAVAKTGAVLTQTEPVSALATLFEQPLTLTLCVAELGLTEDELPRRLQAASGVRRVLGTALIPGGTVQRDLFAAEFANIVKDLRLGQSYNAPSVRLPHDLPSTAQVPTLLLKPTIAFTVPTVTRATLLTPTQFQVSLEPFVKGPQPTIKLLLKLGEQAPRVIPMKKQDKVWVATASPGVAEPSRVDITVYLGGSVMMGSIPNKTFRVAGKSLKLSEVQRIQLRGKPSVVLAGGKSRIEGEAADLGSVELDSDGQKLSIDLARAHTVFVQGVPQEGAIQASVLVEYEGKELAKSEAKLTVHEAAIPAVADPTTVKVTPPRLDDDKVIYKLPEKFGYYVLGGAGRYLIFHLPNQKQLAIFDVNEAKVTRHIPVSTEDMLFTAGLETVVIAQRKTGVLERWSLNTGELEYATRLQPRLEINGLTMGYGSRGPLLINGTSWDLDFRRLPIGNTNIGSGQGSGDGTVYTGWVTHLSPAYAMSYVLEGNHYRRTDVGFFGHVLTGPDGQTIYTAAGLRNQFFGHTDAHDTSYGPCIPAVRGDYFLGVSPTSRLTVYLRGLKQAITTLDKASHDLVLDGIDQTALHARRVLLVPDAKLLIVLPPNNDQVVMHRFDADAALDTAVPNHLLVTSRPHRLVNAGATFTYPVRVKSNKGGVLYRLDGGPKGMTVSANGVITWTVPADRPAGEQDVILSVRDRSGQEVFHNFSVRILR